MTRGTEIEYGRLRDALAAEGRSGLLSGLIISPYPIGWMTNWQFHCGSG